MPTPLNTELLANPDYTQVSADRGGDGKPLRSYKWRGVNEIQLPFSWDFWMQTDQSVRFDNMDAWIRWAPPETRLLYPLDFPEAERSQFTPDGKPKIKGFKGNGATWFALLQTIKSLTPGFYAFQIAVFPDMVDHYDSGQKFYAPDPLSAELKLSASSPIKTFETNWINGSTMGMIVNNKWRPFGAWYLAQLTMEVPAAITELDLIVEVRGRWPLQNNGWFFAEASCKKLCDTAQPPPEPPGAPPNPNTDKLAADVAQLTMRVDALQGRYDKILEDLISVVETVHSHTVGLNVSFADLLADLRNEKH